MTQCTKQFDPTKPCRTRGGKKARIICVDKKNKSSCPLVVLIDEGEFEADWIFPSCGHYWDSSHSDSTSDLINISDEESELERVDTYIDELIEMYSKCENPSHKLYAEQVRTIKAMLRYEKVKELVAEKELERVKKRLIEINKIYQEGYPFKFHEEFEHLIENFDK